MRMKMVRQLSDEVFGNKAQEERIKKLEAAVCLLFGLFVGSLFGHLIGAIIFG